MLGERQDKIYRCEEDRDWKIDFQKAGMVANMANAISAAMYDIFEKYLSENESIIKVDRLSLANKIDELLVKISEITQTPKYNLIANLLKEDFASSEDLSKLFHSFFEKLNKIVNLIKNKNKIMKQNYLFGLILSLEKKNINIVFFM